jgi:putative glutathione S-transferase
MTASDFPRENRDGRFVRQQSAFRDRVTADGSSGLRTEPGRYHLYVSLACPWAHRTIIVRMLKGLEEAIPMTIVDPVRDERGWRFDPAEPDPLHGWTYLSEAYRATDPHFDGRVTVPVLWDTRTRRIISNESADIIKMLNTEWDEWARNPELNLWREDVRVEGAELNEQIYHHVNNGVYRAGFATTQEAYEEAVIPLFEMLDTLARGTGAGCPPASHNRGGTSPATAPERRRPRARAPRFPTAAAALSVAAGRCRRTRLSVTSGRTARLAS